MKQAIRLLRHPAFRKLAYSTRRAWTADCRKIRDSNPWQRYSTTVMFSSFSDWLYYYYYYSKLALSFLVFNLKLITELAGGWPFDILPEGDDSSNHNHKSTNRELDSSGDGNQSDHYLENLLSRVHLLGQDALFRIYVASHPSNSSINSVFVRCNFELATIYCADWWVIRLCNIWLVEWIRDYAESDRWNCLRFKIWLLNHFALCTG